MVFLATFDRDAKSWVSRQYSPLEHGQVLNSGSPFAPLGATLGTKYEPRTLGMCLSPCVWR